MFKILKQIGANLSQLFLWLCEKVIRFPNCTAESYKCSISYTYTVVNTVPDNVSLDQAADVFKGCYVLKKCIFQLYGPLNPHIVLLLLISRINSWTKPMDEFNCKCRLVALSQLRLKNMFLSFWKFIPIPAPFFIVVPHEDWKFKH